MADKPTYEELEHIIETLKEEVSRYKRAYSEVSETSSRYKTILEGAVDAIVVVNDKGNIIEWPVQAELICGWSRNEILGKPIFKIMPRKYRDRHKVLFREVLDGNRGRVFGKRIEASVLTKDTHEVPVQLSVTLNQTDNCREVTLFMHDITERKKTEKLLRHMSITDELTGVFNRRGFMTLADKQLKQACRAEKSIFLLYADFDNMKWLNDNRGHRIGDAALIETANILKNTFRQADLIGRVGGDEFVVLLSPSAGVKDESGAIARLDDNIARFNADPEKRFQIMISTGMVRYDPDQPCSIEDLMSRADNLMYANKKWRKKQRSGLFKDIDSKQQSLFKK